MNVSSAGSRGWLNRCSKPCGKDTADMTEIISHPRLDQEALLRSIMQHDAVVFSQRDVARRTKIGDGDVLSADDFGLTEFHHAPRSHAAKIQVRS
jgi:hypothetical protein